MKVKPIGKFIVTDKQITVEIAENYSRGLREIEHFSHLRIISLDNHNKLILNTVELLDEASI